MTEHRLTIRGLTYGATAGVLRSNKALLFAIILAIALSLVSPAFLTYANLSNLVQQVAVLTIVAVAATMILGAGEIDLSVGGIVGLSGAIMAKLTTEAGLPLYVAIPLGLVAGAICGALNATIISLVRIPPFIATLATNSLYIGVIYIITNLLPVSVSSDFAFIGQGQLGPIPMSLVIMVPAAVLVFLITRFTVFGEHVLALGGSPEAVRLSGINTAVVRLILYATVGAFCAAGGAVLTGITASAQISGGSDLMLLVIASIVIGGTPLIGGSMSILGTFFGCLVIGSINNGLVLLNVNPNFQIIFQGALILFALVVDSGSRSMLVRLTVWHRRASGGDGTSGNRPISYTAQEQPTNAREFSSAGAS